MKHLIAEIGLVVTTAIVVVVILTMATSNAFMDHMFGAAVANTIQQNDEDYLENARTRSMVQRPSPKVSVAVEVVEMSVGDSFDLLSIVSAVNADGVDLTPSVICRIYGKVTSPIFVSAEVGTYEIEYYVVDVAGGVDFGNIGRGYVTVNVLD